MIALDELRPTQTDPVLTPDDAAYAEAVRRWGPPSSPDVLVTPASAGEVGAALRWAAANGMEVAVRSGGHGAWSPVPGGLMVDLGHFQQVEVLDDDLVRVGAGATWGEVADSLGAHGLALSSGDTRSVGVGGNALGAGIGWLVRSVGLALDQVRAAQVVTADGRVVRASPDEHPDLFFAIRGGGGNFGVVTHLDFQAARLDSVVFGAAPIETARLAEAVRGVRDAMRNAPHALTVTLVKPPAMDPGPQIPPMLQMVWAGPDEAAARAAFAPLLAAAGVGEVDVRVIPYASALISQPTLPPGPPPTMVGNAVVVDEISDVLAERAAAALAALPASMFEIRFLGGAVSEVPVDATAIAWRGGEAIVHWIGILPPGAPAEDVAAARRYWEPVGEGAAAVLGTFTMETGPEVVARIYPPATLGRLQAVKATWDPGNLFRRNHNITPTNTPTATPTVTPTVTPA